jgi:hypothetical protein
MFSHPRNPSSTSSIAPSIAPFGTPSAFRPQLLLRFFHSDTSILSLPRKKKVVLLDMSATSAESPNTLALIKNVDMMQLMLDS